MKIAIDISPISGSLQGHKIRGVGFYTEYLKRALLQYYPEHQYYFFSQQEKIPDTIDLVHYPYFDPFFLTLPLFDKHKRVVTVHDLIPIVFPTHFPSGIKGGMRWRIQKSNLRRSQRIITVSHTSQKDITKLVGISKSKIDVVYPAAAEEFHRIENLELNSKKIKQKYQLPDKFVLYVGDVTWNKNLPQLVKAIKKINLTLVMVGKSVAEIDFDRTNPWNKDLVIIQQLVKDDKRFIRIGFVPTEDLVYIYNSATVFVFPSISEGFGLPIIEAMQCGCPVVVNQASSMVEVGGNAVHYIDGNDINDLANGIGEVYFNKKLQEKLSELGVQQAKKFSWKATARATIQAYEHAMSD